jgi:predicted O-methyltransferase YrrM
MDTDQIIKKTSDSFFQSNKDYFDLFFIDGDHTALQVFKDIENSLKWLNDNGCIVLHDICPLKKNLHYPIVLTTVLKLS